MMPVHRIHRMPFGSQLEGGGVRFRLWAPSAEQVALCLGDAELPMPAAGEGWFAFDVAGAQPGCRYRFRIDGDLLVPDPASRYNPDDVHGASEVVDAEAFAWNDGDWQGRPWEEAVIYELHVGSFTPEGTFAAVVGRLDYLVELGVTAIELMPVGDFPGRHNWGYDGVLPFAPDSRYGRPEDLKRLVEAAHACGLMVLLDVVYNHFGPEGNYLHAYAAPFFNAEHQTPWGPAINFDGAGSGPVRDFFIHNALYWLEEYHLDGLRLDAVHAIADGSTPDIVEAIAEAVRQGPGRQRRIHLILENDRNQARYLGRDADGVPLGATAQWNDDFHHALHVLLTGETDGYYADYADAPVRHLGRCLAEGFAFQGEVSAYRHHARRGEASRHLPPAAFVAFLQNHDQIGNRAFGDRLGQLAEPAALAAATAILLLAPAPPLLFMGEEFDAAQPFLYFCDFGPELAAAVNAGRRQEFARFAAAAEGLAPVPMAVLADLPDANATSTFTACVLDRASLETPPHDRWLAFYRQLLALRRQQIMPRLRGMGAAAKATCQPLGERVLSVSWQLGEGSRLVLLANLGEQPFGPLTPPPGVAIYRSDNLPAGMLAAGCLPPWSVAWLLDAAQSRAGP